MKKSVSFSADEVEKLSSNFTELRKKGIAYIQELSGDVWTDYNSHDPGVTILEQLCYATTDLAFRTSLPIEDLLMPGKDLPVNAKANSFVAPSDILSSHPVTLADTRKMIIDHFDDIQNAWVVAGTGQGHQEEVRGMNRVEILPTMNLIHSLQASPAKKVTFLNQINQFLSENRNLGESFEPPLLLEPQLIHIDFDVYLKDQSDTEAILATLFLKLFEFIYSPIQYYNFEEMEEAGYKMEQLYAGPKTAKGFIKNDSLGSRQTTIHVNELQKLFSKIADVEKCEVQKIVSGGKSFTSLVAEKDKFFHLDVDNGSRNTVDSRMESIYSGLNVYVNNKKLPSINKKVINNLFFELWSKKYRGFSIGQFRDESFHQALEGTFRNPGEYYSIQHHFPIIYGIGKDGLSAHEPEERKAKAFQLKAYLMLFEQHMANHLSQLKNLNEFFNIDFRNGQEKTYFSQQMPSIPNYEKLSTANQAAIDQILESEPVFFHRKNRVYNHLLARFGEEMNDTPWKVALRLNLIKDEKDFHRLLLQQKSAFLMQLETLSYDRMKGESFGSNESQFERKPSGLEQLIALKTGIPLRGSQSLIPDFTLSDPQLLKYKEDPVKNIDELNHTYRPLSAEEQTLVQEEPGIEGGQNAMFGEIGVKALFSESLDYKNYRLSIPKSNSDRIQVIFQKEPNKWVSLFDCDSETIACQNIGRIINYFIEQNKQSEGLFIVDHILLSDFLNGCEYGFCFLDEYGEPFFQTIEKKSWGGSKAERQKCLDDFYHYSELKDAWSFADGKWMIKDSNDNILATYEAGDSDLKVDGDEMDQLFMKLKNTVQLFNGSADAVGRLLFDEVEKIRLMGTMSQKSKNYSQRRLVFQRKLPSGEIINEDFFDMNVSIVLPNWPARFQDERFNDYVYELINERIPAHIGNSILWIDLNKFNVFEEKYRVWEKVKSESGFDEEPSESLKSAAYELYRTINELKQSES
ncbi:MAG TPA: hypothetical protein VKA27_00380 [Sunxiuqinia sp.]|nr:hypothetical protein [Sunxiuqinia sp.]